MDDKEKVLIVHNYYQIPGGEDVVVANEKKLLEEHGHEVLLYTRSNSELKEMPFYRKILLPFTSVFSLKTYRETRRIIREQHIDIVHVHNTLSLISPSVYYAALSCGVPVVQTIHNFRLLCPGAAFYRDGHICEECVAHGLNCAVRHACYRKSRLQTLVCVIGTKLHRTLGIYRKLNYICLTEFNKEKLLELNRPGKKQIINPERVYVKPNFVESRDEIIPYEKREDFFIYVGRLEKIKGTGLLFQAWAQMGKDAPRLLVCGTGPMEEWCREFLHTRPDAQIEMMGYVPNEKVRELIAKAKALVLPSQCYETFGLVIIEAYSAGTPVIGSDLGNVGNLIIDRVTGTKFDFLSIESFIKAVNFLINEKAFSARKIKEVFDQYYTETENIQSLENIYSEVMSRTA